jgi:hypothetical protein
MHTKRIEPKLNNCDIMAIGPLVGGLVLFVCKLKDQPGRWAFCLPASDVEGGR